MANQKHKALLNILAVVLAVALLYTATAYADADSERISGVIIDAETQNPIPGASVLVVDRFSGTLSDTEGRFTLDRLSKGNYTLQISHIGYETITLDSIIIEENKSTDLTVRLTPRITALKGITVTPGRFNIMGSQPAAEQTLTQREIRTIPQLGDDFFRAVNRLPGMSSSDFSTKFTVRGGEYEEVLVTLDGLRIYEPFHLKDIDGGAMSIIDVAAVESIDLMTGGFPANYGDKMSAAFNIKSRRVPADESRISVGLSFINARMLAEGTFGNNRGSWLLAARRGYIDYVLRLADADDNIDPKYYDIFSKLQYQLSDRHILAAHILHAHDDLSYIGEDDEIGDTLITEYGNSYAWVTLWSELHPKLLVQTVASIGMVDHNRYGANTSHFGQTQMLDLIASDDEDFRFIGLKTDWEYETSDLLIFKSGVEIQRQQAEYDYISRDFRYNYNYDPVGDSHYVNLDRVDSTLIPLKKSGTKFGGYITGRYRISEQVVTEVGLRLDQASYTDDNLVSPRANLAYNLSDRSTLRLGWGHYYQIEGMDEISVGDGERDFYPAQRAEHRVAGFEHEFESGVRLRLEAYHKLYTSLRPAFRNSFDDIEAFPERESDRTIIYREKSDSRGVELYLKKDTGGRLSWWLSYAYSRVKESVHHIYFPHEDVSAFYNIVIPTPQDQRHTFYLDLHYRPSSRWQISSAFQFHTGWPYTDVFLASQTTSEGTYYWVQAGEQWAARHDSYQRLDLRINRYFPLSKGRITAFIEMLNVMGRKNVRGYTYNIRYDGGDYYLERNPEHWFARIPSFGIAYEFEF